MPLNVGVKFDVSGLSKGTFMAKVEANILDALDKAAALVANSAKENHTKYAYQSTVGVGYAGVNRAQAEQALLDRIRTPNPDGTLRFLTRTGNLVNSIVPIAAARTGGGFSAKVVSGMEYADKVEYGDVTSRPFPYMRPALEENREEIMRLLSEAVAGGVAG